MHQLKGAILTLILAVTSAAAEEIPSGRDFEELLTALGEPPQLVCPSGIKTAAAASATDPAAARVMAEKILADPAFLLKYRVVLNEASHEQMLETLQKAVSATSRPELLKDVLARFESDMSIEDMQSNLGRIGLSADSVIDMVTLYLVAVWAIQEKDQALAKADAEQIADTMGKVRDQVIIAESSCGQLVAMGEELDDVYRLVFVRFSAISLGAENIERSGGLEDFGAFVGAASGKQIEGLTLGPNGFE
jgi:hypothetical protein